VIPTGIPNEGVECRWRRQKSRFSTNIWLSDRWLLQCEQQRRRDRAVYRTDGDASVILFITTSMDDHDEKKRTHLSCTQR